MTTNSRPRERSAQGLQAMMHRWEQLHPVNAVQIAWLNRQVTSTDAIAAAERVFCRLGDERDVRARDSDDADPRFEFEHRPFIGDWRDLMQHAVTSELNRPYDEGDPPWRLFLFESPVWGQFLALGYRHRIADARSVALILHEIVRLAVAPAEQVEWTIAAGGAPVHEMFSSEFELRRLPNLVASHLSEMWASRRAFRPPRYGSSELRMEFRVHDAELPIGSMKSLSRRHEATINDLVCAAMLEWFARRFPPEARGRRSDLSLAVLADLTSRAGSDTGRAFGQYLSQYAVRAAVTPAMTFEEVVERAVRCGRDSKQIVRLIHNLRGFSLMARAWDLAKAVRRPIFLPALIPLLGGISNVHLSAVTRNPHLERTIRGYFRATCVTNILPMMLCITTVADRCTITTTHRPAIFADEDVNGLVEHVAGRLGAGAARVQVAEAA